MRIRPLEIMTEEKCLEILRPSSYYNEAEDKVRYWRQELPVRLEKINEIAWKKYPPQTLENIEKAKEEMMIIAEKAGNIPVQNHLRLVHDFLDDIIFLFKNYEEMVAYVTMVIYEIEKENYPEKLRQQQEESNKQLDELELKLIEAQTNYQNNLDKLHNENLRMLSKVQSLGYLKNQLNGISKTIDLINSGCPAPVDEEVNQPNYSTPDVQVLSEKTRPVMEGTSETEPKTPVKVEKQTDSSASSSETEPAEKPVEIKEQPATQKTGDEILDRLNTLKSEERKERAISIYEKLKRSPVRSGELKVVVGDNEESFKSVKLQMAMSDLRVAGATVKYKKGTNMYYLRKK